MDAGIPYIIIDRLDLSRFDKMRSIKIVSCFIVLLIVLNVVGCATSQHPTNIYEPEKFYLVVASEEDILAAAQEALLEVYPYTLFLPLLTQQPGFYWETNGWDMEYIDYDSRPNNQFELRLEQSLGLTEEGSIISGYRYQIISYGNGFINDITEIHYLDIVFRSELFKRKIERIKVEELL